MDHQDTPPPQDGSPFGQFDQEPVLQRRGARRLLRNPAVAGILLALVVASPLVVAGVGRNTTSDTDGEGAGAPASPSDPAPQEPDPPGFNPAPADPQDQEPPDSGSSAGPPVALQPEDAVVDCEQAVQPSTRCVVLIESAAAPATYADCRQEGAAAAHCLAVVEAQQETAAPQQEPAAP